jgi:uncharacterized membrane protein YedE/YeeE
MRAVASFAAIDVGNRHVYGKRICVRGASSRRRLAMTRALIALVSGLLFGAGLAYSGMSDPARVQAFLDLFGQWDPTLAFVMGGAMLPMAVAWVIRSRLSAPLAAPAFDLPGTATLDRPLAFGAILFGMGWGIAGLCPGPALADLAIAPGDVAPFVVAMFVGMAVQRLVPFSSQKTKQAGA